MGTFTHISAGIIEIITLPSNNSMESFLTLVYQPIGGDKEDDMIAPVINRNERGHCCEISNITRYLVFLTLLFGLSILMPLSILGFGFHKQAVVLLYLCCRYNFRRRSSLKICKYCFENLHAR